MQAGPLPYGSALMETEGCCTNTADEIWCIVPGQVISVEAARNRTWTESAMFDDAADLAGEVVMHEGFGGPYFARAFIATIPLGERRPFLAPGQVASDGPRVWEDSPGHNTTVDLSGEVSLREGFGGPYVAVAKAYTDQLGERRPFLAPGTQVGDGWIINRGSAAVEGRKWDDSPAFDPEAQLSGEIAVNELGFGGPFIARAACGSTALGVRRDFIATVHRGLKPRGDPFDLLGIEEGGPPHTPHPLVCSYPGTLPPCPLLNRSLVPTLSLLVCALAAARPAFLVSAPMRTPAGPSAPSPPPAMPFFARLRVCTHACA